MFSRIADKEIVPSWKDAYISSSINCSIPDFLDVPTYGCFIDRSKNAFQDRVDRIDRIWSIARHTEWWLYYGNWLWLLRGFIDILVGRVGLRRGRTNLNSLNADSTSDSWGVLDAYKKEGRLLLFAVMKLPGEAWLEFSIVTGELIQISTFRPLGLIGGFYWFPAYQFYSAIFNRMLKKTTNDND